MKEHEKLKLTQGELDAVARDEAVLDMARSLNAPSAAPMHDADFEPVSDLLYWARDSGIPQMKIALQSGADVNASQDVFQTKQYTPLHSAAENGQVRAVQFLLDNNANVNARLGNAPGKTPLDLARDGRYADVEALLLERGGKSHVQLNR